MRVQFRTEGGVAYLPGLAKPVEIDTAQLPKEQADTLCRLIHDVDFFDLPAMVNQLPRGAADFQVYTISVEEDRRRHTVRVADPVPEQLRPLIDQLQATARAIRAASRTTSQGQQDR